MSIHHTLFTLIFLITSCSAQKKILYTYDAVVNESILKALNDMNEKFNVKEGNFKEIFAIVSENNGDVNIVFNNSKHMPISIIKLIPKTNRFIKLNKYIKIPVLYRTDVVSLEVRKEGLPYLPYGGNLVVIDFKGTKVLKEGVLF